MWTDSDRAAYDRWGLDMESSKALDRYRVPDTGLCWWCREQSASTAEHRFKATDLRQMADVTSSCHPDPSSIFHVGSLYNGVLKTVKKGNAVRWSKSLCKDCNGGRDHKMDASYERYSDYVWTHQNELATARVIDWKVLYGVEWRVWVVDLARYFAKQLGCLLSQQSLPITDEIIEFMDGKKEVRCLSFEILRDSGRLEAHRMAVERGQDCRGIWMPQAYGWPSRAGDRIEIMGCETYIGFVGMRVEYDANKRRSSIFSARRYKIEDVTCVEPHEVRKMISAEIAE